MFYHDEYVETNRTEIDWLYSHRLSANIPCTPTFVIIDIMIINIYIYSLFYSIQVH